MSSLKVTTPGIGLMELLFYSINTRADRSDSPRISSLKTSALSAQVIPVSVTAKPNGR